MLLLWFCVTLSGHRWHECLLARAGFATDWWSAVGQTCSAGSISARWLEGSRLREMEINQTVLVELYLDTCLFWVWASCAILYIAILLYILKVPRPDLWSEFGSWWETCKEWHIMECAVPGCPESYDHDTRVQHHGQPNGRQGLSRDSCLGSRSVDSTHPWRVGKTLSTSSFWVSNHEIIRPACEVSCTCICRIWPYVWNRWIKKRPAKYSCCASRFEIIQ